MSCDTIMPLILIFLCLLGIEIRISSETCKKNLKSLLCKGTCSVCQRKGHESNYFSQKDRVKRCFQYFSHKCSKSMNYSEFPRKWDSLLCTKTLKEHVLYVKWKVMTVTSVHKINVSNNDFNHIRNDIWERIRCQTLHIVLRLSEVESSLEYFEGVIKWIADPSPQSLLCHRPMEPIFYLFAGIGKIRY